MHDVYMYNALKGCCNTSVKKLKNMVVKEKAKTQYSIYFHTRGTKLL